MSDKEPSVNDMPEAEASEELRDAELDAEANGDEVNGDEANGDAEQSNPAEALMQRLEEAEARAAEMHNKSLRALAELDNFRKRMARDRQELLKTAAAEVIESLLPALDNLKLGLDAAKNHPEAAEVTKGFEMVSQQILAALQDHGLLELNPEGAAFDPHFHDSLTTQPSEELEEGHVLQTVKVGYLLNDKLLRPAAVVVSSGKPEPKE